MKKTTKKSNKWFTKVRGSYLPNNSAGWLTYIPYLGYLIGATVVTLYQGYSFVTCLLLLVPNWVAAAAVMNWVAASHS